MEPGTDSVLAPDAWGIQQHWVDAYDQPHRVPEATLDALRRVIGTPPPDLEDRAPVVTRPGRTLGLGRLEVECEDGTPRDVRRRAARGLPPRLPPASARWPTVRRRRGGGWSSRPAAAGCPSGQRWGWSVQLYAARSRSSWGIGDLGDLRTLREWTASVGGGFLLVNPLHAVGPTLPQEASPYLPATRRFRNPVYLRVDEVPGHEAGGGDGAGEAERQRLNGSAHIDRDGVWALKRAALWRAFDASGARTDAVVRRLARGPGPGPGGVRHLERARRGARPGLADLAGRAASARPRRRWRRTPPPTPTGSPSTPGCSGCSTSSCARRPATPP